ncbi:MAG TPA: GMC family oxidoreductase [Pyrinomonadaceae bacterium]|jgi:cholesterol oxidase
MSENDFDAVIIGSGFGGSVMAYRLAEAGLRVCLLERGKTYPPFSFPRAPYKLKNNFWDPSEGLYGMFNVWSFKGSGAVVSSGLGGGSLIYANVIIRKDEKWFIDNDIDNGSYQDWVVTRADLEPHYDNVQRMMNIQKYPFESPGFSHIPKTRAMKEAAEKIKAENPNDDISWQLLNLAVSFRQRHVDNPENPDEVKNPPVIGEPIIEEHANYHNKTRYTCVQCGECDFGCNTGSKNTLDYTYISAAHRQQADIRTLCEVKSFAPRDSGKGYQVTYIKHDPEKWEGEKVDTGNQCLFPPQTITCDRLIISAGTFGSPFLLFKNRDAFPNLSKKLGSRFCVNGDILSFIRDSKETRNGKTVPRVLDPNFGPVITSAIRLSDTLDGLGRQGRGFYLEDGGYPYMFSWGVELKGFVNLLRRSAHFAKMFFKYRLGFNPDADLSTEISTLMGDCSFSKSTMPMLAMGRDIPNGVMSFDGKYLDCDWEIKKSQEYFDRVIRIVKSIAGALEGEYGDDPFYHHFHEVITAHPLGGCAMGRDKQHGVVDSYGEVFDYPGLYVIDGSMMPGPVGPNPSMTIAAVSDRAAEHIIHQHKGVN